MDDIRNAQHDIKIDVIRLLSCFLVVGLHSSGAILGSYNQINLQTFAILAFRCICSVAVPTFFAISGYLLLFYKNKTAKDIISKNLLKYLVSYTVWLSLYLIFCSYLVNGDFNLSNVYNYIINNYHDSSYLWFLKVYITILLCFPIIKHFSREPQILHFYTLLWLVFIVVRYTLAPFYLFSPRLLYLIQIPFAENNSFFTGTLISQYPTALIGFFLLGGYFIHRIKNSSLIQTYRHIITVFTIFIAVLMFYYSSILYENPQIVSGGYDTILQPLMLWVVLLTIGVIIFVYSYTNSLILSKYGKAISSLCSDTYGIYVVHGFVLPLIIRKFSVVSIDYIYLKFIIVFLITLLSSLFFVRILKFTIPKIILKYII